MNYSKAYGITLKEAKERCKEANGKLPRMGYEMVVPNTSFEKFSRTPGTQMGFWWDGEVYLVNISGSYKLTVHGKWRQ